MDLNQVRSFIAVTQTLNFTSAARQRGVPQSTISRHISDLEGRLGVPLFFRTKRNVELTEEGRAFLPYAREMLEASRKGAEAVQQLYQGARGRLSIATIPTSVPYLTEQLNRFSRSNPDIAVDINFVSCCDPFLDEGEDPFDFHFLHADLLPDSDAYDSAYTHLDHISLVCRKDDLLTKQVIGTQALQDRQFLLISEQESPILSMEVLQFCTANRFSPKIRLQSNDLNVILTGVRAGLGITFLPSSIRETVPSEIFSFLPLDDTDFTMQYAVTWKRSMLNPAARLFLQSMQENR